MALLGISAGNQPDDNDTHSRPRCWQDARVSHLNMPFESYTLKGQKIFTFLGAYIQQTYDCAPLRKLPGRWIRCIEHMPRVWATSCLWGIPERRGLFPFCSQASLLVQVLWEFALPIPRKNPESWRMVLMNWLLHTMSQFAIFDTKQTWLSKLIEGPTFSFQPCKICFCFVLIFFPAKPYSMRT